MKIKDLNSQTQNPISLTLLLLTTALAAHAQSWTNQFDGAANVGDFARAMVVDNSGNVIITGTSDAIAGLWDCVTIKYSASGVPLWTNRYGSPNGYDEPAGIVVDAAGNTFLAVNVGAIIKYSSAGLPLWTNLDLLGQGGFTAVALDGGGNVCVTGGDTTASFLTVKYSNNGLPLWTNRYNAPDGTGVAKRIKVDSNDNVIVGGDSNGINYDYFTIKYSGSGVGLWTNVLAVTGISVLGGLVVDGQGNVLVTGANGADGVPTTLDVLTMKYSSTGILMWTKRFNGPANDEDVPAGVAVDDGGNVFVAGSSSAGGLPHCLTIKYSGTGIPLWTNYYTGPFGSGASAVAVDQSGNVFVAGGNFDTIAYSNSGLPLWTNRYNDAFRGSATAIAVDRAGNVIATGSLPTKSDPNDPGFSDSSDYLTIKYAVEVSAPTLNLQRLGSNMVLSWTNAAFGLQSAPAISGMFTNIPGATSPYTNAIPGAQRFFRLVQ
jgi:hypothetical protein